MRPLAISVLGAFVIATGALAPRAQIIAPVLEKHAVELGYAYKWFDRDVPAPVDEAQWEVASFFGRFGAFDWLTLVAEGGLWGIEHDDFPGQPYSRWVIGGGLSARLYRARHWDLTATVVYSEVYDHDDSDFRFDKRTRGWNAGVLAGSSFMFSGQRLDLWAGPMFVDDLIENYTWGFDEPLTSEPETQWGVAAGAYTVIFDYISGFAYVLYADHPQVRLGIGLRSRGDE
jgi:hypothetical protein